MAEAAPTTTPPAAQMTFREVLGITVMRRVWYAQIISLLGDFLALFAVISVVTFRMHATPAQVSLVQIAYMLPFAFLGPLSGVFVDRWPLKPTLVSSDLIRAGLVVLLVLSSGLWEVYAIFIALSAVSTFFMPAQTVTIRSYVPPHGLISANALMQTAMLSIRVIGPLAAGILVAELGPQLCYTLDAGSFVASAALIGTVAIVRPPMPKREGAPTSRSRIHALVHEMSLGGRFIIHHAALLFVVLAMAAALFTVGCFAPFVAVFIRETLHASARTFGIVSAMIGIGMFAGSLVMRRMAKHLSNDTMVLGSLVGVGAALVLLAAVPYLAATLVACFALGLSIAGIMVPANTLLQRETPHELMGRISSTVMSFVVFAQLLGLIVSGIASQLLSVRTVFAASAGLSLSLAGAGRIMLHVHGKRT